MASGEADRTNKTAERRDFAAQQWYIVGRWQQYEGETRACLLRMVAIAALYLVQLLQFYLLLDKASDADSRIHRQFTLLALAGTLVSLAMLMSLRQKFFPPLLSYLSASIDVLLVTMAAWLVAGPQSVLVRVYFIVIAAAALRMNLRIIWLVTLLAMLGYESLVALADKTWFDANHEVPPTENLVMLVSLALTGVVIGQVVRRTKTLAEEYARRLAAAKESL